jgi:hypothetical protein
MLTPLATLLLVACGSGDAANSTDAKPAATTPANAAASADAVDGTVKGFFQPYQASDSGPSEADWDRPIYSANLRDLIGRWKQDFTDEGPLELQDFGWFCECQDWDAAKFTVEVLPHSVPQDGKVEVTARFDPGWNETRDMTFDLVDQGGQWLIDDISAGSFEGGLRDSLDRAIVTGPA